MINVLICGIRGKMGGNILDLLKNDDQMTVVGGVDKEGGEIGGCPVYGSFAEVEESPDVIIDFSSPSVLKSELEYAKQTKAALVLGSTGYTAEDVTAIGEAAESVAVFRTANFSLGVNLLVKLVKEAASVLGENFDIEIVEKHHAQKVDAPSGTALMLAESANAAFDGGKSFLYGREGICGKRGGEIGIHAVRGGTIVGEHEVLFCGEDEIITLSHSARSKRVFAAGAIKAAKWLAGKPAGAYDMNDVLGLQRG